MEKYFIGLDISTTGSKALALSPDGALVASAAHPHPLSTPRPLWAEQNPDDWWKTASAALRELLLHIPAAQVAAVGLTGQMLGLTALDDRGRPLRPAILWNDQRSGAQCDAITEQVGARRLYQIIGSMLIPGITAPKIVWLREHEPDVYRQIARLLLPKDYVRYKLSGTCVTDVADASGFGLLDIGRRVWSDEMLAALDIPRDWLPGLCESPEICAVVNADGAAATGLKAGTPIVGGAGDQSAQALGSGIVASGDSSLTVGTSGVLFVAANRYAPDEDGRLHTFCHAVPDAWCYMGVMQSAAGSLRWWHDELAPAQSYDQLNAQVAVVPRGARGLLFAPYLSGERHPHPDPLARGAFVGLTLRHDPAAMTRAVMEGVAFGLRDLVEIARAKGIYPGAAAISGGAASSSVWRQMTTDIMNMPLHTVNTTEGAAFGAAILAAVGAGEWPDVPSACRDLVRVVDETRPEPDGVAAYDRLYASFRGVYPALRQTFAALARYEDGA